MLRANQYIQLMVVGLFGESVVKLVEVDLRQELVRIRRQLMEELIVQENQFVIVTQTNVLVKPLIANLTQLMVPCSLLGTIVLTN